MIQEGDLEFSNNVNGILAFYIACCKDRLILAFLLSLVFLSDEGSNPETRYRKKITVLILI